MEVSLEDIFIPWRSALDRLDEALESNIQEDMKIDLVIQRFEFTFELTWKSTRRLIKQFQGDSISSPKPVLIKAYSLGWIDDEEIWLNMLDDRNMTSHTYKAELAKEIYGRIDRYYELMRQLYNKLSSQYK